MISAVTNHITDFSNLTAEISRSVERIKEKTATLNLETNYQTASQTQTNNFSPNSYAVSYLEPQALYTVQKLASEIGSGEHLNQEQKQNILNEEQRAPAELEQLENQKSFWEELSTLEDNSFRLYGFSAYGMRVFSENNLFGMLPVSQSVTTFRAADAYNEAANLNTPPQVLIDFIHEFNRKFDYTI